MKKNLLISIAGIFLLSVIGIAANCQIASTDILPTDDLAFPVKPVLKIEPNKINPKAVRDLAKSFKGVSGEKWIELHDGFVAIFNLDDVSYQVAYDKKGNWVHTIRSYGEGKLSSDLRHVIKSNYYDYNIKLIQEVERLSDPLVYVVELTGKKELIRLKICEGEMQQLEKFSTSE